MIHRFRSMIESMIIDSNGRYSIDHNTITYSVRLLTKKTLSNIKKFQYLNSAVKDDAARCSEALGISHSTYELAWNTLKAQFEDPGTVAYHHTQTLVDLPAIVKPSVTSLKQFSDNLNNHISSDVVYYIKCRDCPASYVDQTKKLLCSRILEHKNYIRRNSSQRSVIIDHRIELSHDFDWDNVRILDEEHSYIRRFVSEMLYIKKQKLSLNLQSDTELLNTVYLPLVGRFKRL